MRSAIFRPGKHRRVWFGMGRGIKLIVDPQAPLHKYIGTIEYELSQPIKHFVGRGSLCFDVGGFDAQLAMTLARHTKAKVCSFEVGEERVARMRENLRLNGLESQVRVIHTEVSDRTTSDPRADTLDDLIAAGRVFVPDFLKIDVEGNEMRVLRGATHLLRGRKPHVLVEIHSTRLALECLLHLEEMGYGEPETISQRRFFPENRGSGRNEWVIARGRDRSEITGCSQNDEPPVVTTASTARTDA